MSHGAPFDAFPTGHASPSHSTQYKSARRAWVRARAPQMSLTCTWQFVTHPYNSGGLEPTGALSQRLRPLGKTVMWARAAVAFCSQAGSLIAVCVLTYGFFRRVIRMCDVSMTVWLSGLTHLLQAPVCKSDPWLGCAEGSLLPAGAWSQCFRSLGQAVISTLRTLMMRRSNP